jgi:hypothetical protein
MTGKLTVPGIINFNTVILTMVKVKNVIVIFGILLASCTKPSTFEVENDLSSGTITNLKWGEVPLASIILPEETTGKVRIYEDAHYNLDFPEEFTLNFFLELNGNKVFLETRKIFKLGNKDEIFVSINDSLEVFEPLKQKDMLLSTKSD